MDETYLSPGRLIESEDPAVVAFAAEAVGDETDPKQKAIKLFYAVRDDVRYDAYLPLGEFKSYSGKEALAMGSGWCVSKAALLAACARNFADPWNKSKHLASYELRVSPSTLLRQTTGTFILVLLRSLWANTNPPPHLHNKLSNK